LPLAQRSIGGLNIYKTADGAFSAAFVKHAEVFAGYAAVAVNNVTGYADATNEASTLRWRCSPEPSSSKPRAS
jgi:hypothetical protein